MTENITELITHLTIQVAVILVAAKLGGEICQRYFRVPSVLGELSAGVIIGPFAIGGWSIFGLDPLFPLAIHGGANSGIPVSTEIYFLAQFASIVLLFVVGLETDLSLFMKYAGPALLVAAGGVIFPFFLGMVSTVIFGPAEGLFSPEALFMGAIMTATSVGITARVLTELKSLHTPEGVTILAAAVVDDVLGILILTIVVGVSTIGSISAGGVAWVGFKAIAFWLVLTGGGILLAPYIARVIGKLQVPGGGVVLFLALALFAAAMAEMFGLALIIGAYSVGLALSRTELAHRMMDPLTAIYHGLVPVFFVVMGMLVDISAMKGALILGVVITLLAIVSKVFGGGLPALATGFTMRGAWRIGFGMLPRGEVALIIAGIGLVRGVIGQDLFGVAILMTVVTTVIAPVVLVPLFRSGGSGRRVVE